MINSVLNQRYEILEKIGDGGMAEVFRAHCRVLNRQVAIKALKQQYVNDAEFVRKFRKESSSAGGLNHPNIINIFDIGEELVEGKTVYYIVMEYVDGWTLKEEIVKKGKLSAQQVVVYGSQIAAALAHAHSHHIIHRDIKPQNIMITKDGIVKLMDFGIARTTNSQTMTMTSEAMGSVHYFSPEQARGQVTDEKTDIYSFGIVLYEMVTGQLPFDGDTPVAVGVKHIQGEFLPPSKWVPNIPVDLERIILKCMKTNPVQRYNNMDEILYDLQKVGSGNSQVDIDDDNSQTRVIPVQVREYDKVEQKPVRQVKKGESKVSNRKSKNVKKKKDRLMTILGVLVAFALVLGAFIVYQNVLKGGLGSNKIDVEVPKIIGKDKAEAEKLLKDVGLEFEVESTVENDEFEPGQVVSINNTAEGNKARQGFVVKVSVKGESDLVQVPDLKGLDEEAAQKIIEEKGFVPGEVKEEANKEIEKGKVITQNPQANEKVEKNTRIDLLISSGEEETVFMPNLDNVDINVAKKQWKMQGYR
ncbi:MAG: Stk1 family PASTA domain-containing Ser/Thr kinase [Tissierellia bacterium]|nr:Stk1 family PASTA domain-containing Ser/Thr kinase [Tissierellia bacterium]